MDDAKFDNSQIAFTSRKKILLNILTCAVIVEDLILLSRLCQIYITQESWNRWHVKSFHSQELENSQQYHKLRILYDTV